MKAPLRQATAFLVFALALPSPADVIYSDLQNVPIPTDFAGVTVTVAGGTFNPFFGGVGVANNNLFQPVRDGTGNADTIQNLSVGSTIDMSQFYATGYGGSIDHLGATFTAGTEGYIGFKAGSSYGWMRVVFTGNTSGAVIKDWAYDNSGSSIVVGRVSQSAPSGGAQLVTLSPGASESFVLGSQITNTGGNTNSVLKTGAGSTTLTGINNYTGSTTVDQGTLVVNGNISTSSLTTVNTGATLSGVGTTGDVHVASGGTFAPGSGIGTLTINGDLLLDSGSVSEFQISPGSSSDMAIVTAHLTFGGTLNITNIVDALEDGDSFDLFDWDSSSGTFSSVILPTLGGGLSWDQSELYTLGVLTVVPEPGSALLGGLGVLLLLRRRRESGWH